MLLHHLCYASGLSEPGLPEGTPRGRRAARRQLRQRLHRRGRLRGHRRGLCQPVGLREGDPRRRPVHRCHLAIRTERQRPCLRLRERSPSRLRRPDGPRVGDIRVRAVDRPASPGSCPPMSAPAPAGSASVVSHPPVDPGPASLARTGLDFSPPRFSATTAAGSTTKLSLPFRIGDRSRLPSALAASLQWVQLDAVATAPPDPTPDARAAAIPGPATSPS